LQKGQGRYTVLLRQIPEMPAIATVLTAEGCTREYPASILQGKCLSIYIYTKQASHALGVQLPRLRARNVSYEKNVYIIGVSTRMPPLRVRNVCMYYQCVYADATVASAEDNQSIINTAHATVASAEVCHDIIFI
jgi:hypothetical protein